MARGRKPGQRRSRTELHAQAERLARLERHSLRRRERLADELAACVQKFYPQVPERKAA